jgi:hypothetical protein
MAIASSGSGFIVGCFSERVGYVERGEKKRVELRVIIEFIILDFAQAMPAQRPNIAEP